MWPGKHAIAWWTYRPHPEEPSAICAPAHAIVARAVAPANDDGELGDVRACDGAHHLRAVLGDAALLRLRADHVPGDVHEEQEGDLALGAQLDEVRRFHGRLGEQDAVVCDNTDRVAMDVCESLPIIQG